MSFRFDGFLFPKLIYCGMLSVGKDFLSRPGFRVVLLFALLNGFQTNQGKHKDNDNAIILPVRVKYHFLFTLHSNFVSVPRDRALLQFANFFAFLFFKDAVV